MYGKSVRRCGLVFFSAKRGSRLIILRFKQLSLNSNRAFELLFFSLGIVIMINSTIGGAILGRYHEILQFFD